MRIPGRRFALLLAVPAVIGLAFATAHSGVLYQADKTVGSGCSKIQKASAGSCAGKAVSSHCGSKVQKGAGASGCCPSGKVLKASRGSCGSGANSCTIETVRTDDALKVYVLGGKKSSQEWMTKLAAALVDEKGLEVEVFEAKDGCWMEIRQGKNSSAFTEFVKASANDGDFCKMLCSSNGCPPKA